MLLYKYKKTAIIAIPVHILNWAKADEAFPRNLPIIYMARPERSAYDRYGSDSQKPVHTAEREVNQ
jgi:hypothetical protein